MTKKKAATAPKRKVGCPTKYNPDIHPMLGRVLADKGMIDTEIAKAMKITTSTYYKWQKEHPEFSEAIKEGKVGINWLLKASLFKKAIGYTQKVKKQVGDKVVEVDRVVDPCYQSLSLSLRNRMPKEFREKVHIEDDTDFSRQKEKLDRLRDTILNDN